MITDKFYTGVGSRETPPEIQSEMAALASILESAGYTLRSGNAPGADQAFANGVEEYAQIWLPWKSFGMDFQLKKPKHTYKIISKLDEEAFDSVNKFHPNGPYLKDSVRNLMARNYRQCKGKVLPDSKFLICWTVGGGLKGGTAQAMKIADSLKIPIYNFYLLTKEEILDKVLGR